MNIVVYRHLAVIVILSLTAAAQAQEKTLEQAESEMRWGWKQLQGFTSTVDFLANWPVGEASVPVKGVGTLTFMNEGTLGKARLVLTGDAVLTVADTETRLPQRAQAVFDGDVLQILSQLLFDKFAMVYNAAEEKQNADSALDLLLKELHENCDLKFLPTGDFNNMLVYVIEATLKEQPEAAKGEASLMRFFLVRDAGIPLRVEVGDRSGNLLGYAQLRNIKRGPQDLGRVDLSIPADYRVIDLNKGETLELNLTPTISLTP